MDNDDIRSAANAQSKKLVGIAVLRKLRKLVDKTKTQEDTDRRAVEVVLVIVGILVMGFLCIGLLSSILSGPAPQSFSVSGAPYGEGKSEAFKKHRESVALKIEAVAHTQFARELVATKLTGSVGLSIRMLKDGTIEAIEINWPSGNELLDRTACRIVMRAAPFEPFPDEMRKIERTRIFRWLHFQYGKEKDMPRPWSGNSASMSTALCASG